MSLRPFSRPPAGQPASTGARAVVDPAAPTSIGTAAAALVVLFLVLLSVFIYLSRLNQGAADLVAAPPAEPRVEATATGASTLGALTVSAAGGYQALRDPRWNYAVLFPEDWPSAAVDGSGSLLAQADHDRVVEDPRTGARMALSVWTAGEDLPLEDWAGRVAPGMQPTDGSWQANATVAGRPALALWAAESATRPGHYVTLLLKDGRLYGLSYAARDGGAALADYAKALVSLSWPNDPVMADQADQVPLFPLPAPRFHPSERLFR